MVEVTLKNQLIKCLIYMNNYFCFVFYTNFVKSAYFCARRLMFVFLNRAVFHF